MEPSFKSYTTAALAYSAAASALYLFGYWGAFDINVFEFVTLSDVLKLAVYPLLVSLSLMALGVIQGQLMWSEELPVGGGADSRVGRFGRKYWRPLLLLVATAALAVAVLSDAPLKWMIVATLLMILVTPVGHTAFFIKWIPHPWARFNIIAQGVFILGAAFSFGHTNADHVIAGTAPLIVDAQRSGIDAQEPAEHPVEYIGRIGEYFVLYETSTNHVLVVSGTKIDVLHLFKNPKRYGKR